MPLSYQLLASEQLIVISGTGDLTTTDIETIIRQIHADPQWEPTYDYLFDYRGIEGTSAPIKDVYRIVDQVSLYRDVLAGSYCAVVAPNLVIYGFARVFQTLVSGWEMKLAVFRSIEDAYFWLEKR
ncbi:MAG: hypothetical protein AAF629_34000 [Chloroflexota bacterium]